MQVVSIDAAQVRHSQDSQELCRQLEQGNILLLRETPFMPAESDADFLRAQQQSQGKSHKNIAYKPHRQQMTGAACSVVEDAERLKEILARYSQGALDFLSALLPAYAASWHVDYASFRPFEEEGRQLPPSHRNDLMHIDAFPTRPTHGGRLLRAFTNLHPTKERVWATSYPFDELAARYAVAAGLPQVTGTRASLRRRASRLARLVGVSMPDRSPYDEFMLRFHHYLKGNMEFQQTGECTLTAFAPGTTWISFTDQIAHAVRGGQYALEQTCIVPHSALLMPELAPLAVLERLAGRRLADASVLSGATA